tara:strand:+ start:852 stop:1904 length:1053 start_codon:yes stop_codon:yes gene_type:complete
MKATVKRYTLDFKRPSGTSRGVLLHKETWFLILEDQGKYGIGECGLLKGLSADDLPDYEARLQWVCDNIQLGEDQLWARSMGYPSIQFGIEQAFRAIEAKDPFLLFPSAFTAGREPILINGLIWMGDQVFMREQLAQKLEEGYDCLKMKIGAIDFETEISILASIRKKYTAAEIELRVDANGAFKSGEALEKLRILADYDLHSIEQPIKAGQHKEMQGLCEKTPLPIALDEELIGIYDAAEKEHLLHTIKPQFIILKPSLVGGYRGSEEWIDLAKKHGIGWWVTSALESNIGLNAIAQWTYELKVTAYQGLGTGGLYQNNFDSPLVVENGKLYYSNSKTWKNNLIEGLCT